MVESSSPEEDGVSGCISNRTAMGHVFVCSYRGTHLLSSGAGRGSSYEIRQKASLSASTNENGPVSMGANTGIEPETPGTGAKPVQTGVREPMPVYSRSFTTRRTPCESSPGTTWNSS